MKLIWRIASVALLIFSGVLRADSGFIEKLKVELKDNLLPIATVIPGYERPASSPPKFAVAEFRTSNVDLINWSRAIAEILRYRIQYVPGGQLVMPDPFLMPH